jgi:hypothetical protein
MIEVLRTNNPVRLDYAVVLLKEAGCYPFVADRFMSAVEGSIPAFERRILVPDEFETLARETLEQLDRAPDGLADDKFQADGDGEP